MTDSVTQSPATRVHRLGSAAGWIAALACLPYLVFKVLWTVNVPVGIADQSVLDGTGWMAGNAVMAVVQLLGLLLVLTLIQPWSRRLPAGLIMLPAWFGTGLLFQVVVGAILVAASSASSDATVDTGAFEPWVFPVVYAGFAAEGAALTIAFACHVHQRWGQLLARRTCDVVGWRAMEGQPWAQAHVTKLAEIVAAMCVIVAVIFGYRAMGGSWGLASSATAVPWALQASRAAGALTAALGLLGVAGRFVSNARLWIPGALTWLGSGAMAAFDGLTVTLNTVLPALGVGPASAGDFADAVVLLKVLIGLVAAAVGVLAFRAAIAGADATGPRVSSDERPG